ncbi:MAG: hypothetical protein ACR2NU_02535 [Aeoliella sp.]
MMISNRPTRTAALVVFAWMITGMAGCALNRLPQIDPTGRQLLVFPDQPTVGGNAPALPPGSLPATPSNTVAAPVFTDSFLPGTPGASASTDALGRPVIVGPPVGTTAGSPVAPATQVGEMLSITPSRVLAPVGSEVILRAGVCASNGYLRMNERIEWMLDRTGTGQIVTVGNRGELDIGRLPRNMPRKIDNYFAIGATSPFEDVLDRGTPNPNDDIQIRRGDAWMTVSSPTEGTSYVTAYAPDVENWSGRTARATIYWVDAQWVFPPPVTLAPGESHTLTTTVTRQSDGAPIAGWIVRYSVAGDGAELGYAGQTSEVTTNAQGRASVEISPTDSNAGTSNIAIEIVRPEQSGVASNSRVTGPRVTLGNGATSITWGEGGISGTPLPPTTQPPTLPPIEAGPISPPGGTFTPPVNPPPPTEARADLFVQIEQVSQEPFRVGDDVNFQVTVVNQGEGAARNVKIVDDFDFGLSNDAAAPGEQFIKTDTPFDLSSGESKSLPLTFRITQPGRLSHNVTATADNAEPYSQRAFIEVDQGVSTAPPSLRVTVDGVVQQTVGELTKFRVTVENTGSTAATNLRITNDRDPELRPTQAYEPYDKQLFLQSGRVQWPVARLEPGAKAVFEIECECIAAARESCSRVEVVADGLTTPQTAKKCIEIRQQLGGGTGVAPPATATGEPVSLNIDAAANPAELQSNFIVFVLARNNTNQTLTIRQLSLVIPPQLQVDRTQLPNNLVGEPMRGDEGLFLNFAPGSLEPGGSYSLPIPVTAIAEGIGPAFAKVTIDGVAEHAVSSDIEVIGRR